MYLADRIRQFREAQHLSQGDVEQRTGLRRCYVSRVENGHTVPALETLEKIARALDTPLYQFFYPEDESPDVGALPRPARNDWASHGKGYRTFRKIQAAVSRMSMQDRRLLLAMAGILTRTKKGPQKI